MCLTEPSHVIPGGQCFFPVFFQFAFAALSIRFFSIFNKFYFSTPLVNPESLERSEKDEMTRTNILFFHFISFHFANKYFSGAQITYKEMCTELGRRVLLWRRGHIVGSTCTYKTEVADNSSSNIFFCRKEFFFLFCDVSFNNQDITTTFRLYYYKLWFPRHIPYYQQMRLS